MGTITIGIDIGQKHDPTALCVAETERRRRGNRSEIHFLIRHLDRLPLGTPYPEVAQQVARITSRVQRFTGLSPTVYVDATGVGQPVVDQIAAEGVGSRLYPVYFTYGDRRKQNAEKVSLGKAYLVSRLQTLLQSGRIHLPRTAESKALASELLNFEIRVDDKAIDRYGAFRVGTHDDLVTALGLAVQIDRESARVISGALARPPGL